jgi:Leucine-rich repeat (LRR) protein
LKEFLCEIKNHKCLFLCSKSLEKLSRASDVQLFVCTDLTITMIFLLLCMQATTEVSEPKRMDISGSGLHIMPEVILQSSHLVEELFAEQNKLQDSALKTLKDFKKLRVVRIAENQFKKFPDQLMDIQNLSVLDISKNDIDRLPDNIYKMEK